MNSGFDSLVFLFCVLNRANETCLIRRTKIHTKERSSNKKRVKATELVYVKVNKIDKSIYLQYILNSSRSSRTTASCKEGNGDIGKVTVVMTYARIKRRAGNTNCKA